MSESADERALVQFGSVSRLVEEHGVGVVPVSSSDNGSSVVAVSVNGESVDFPVSISLLLKVLSDPDGSSKTMSAGFTPLPPLLSTYSTTVDGGVVVIAADKMCILHSEIKFT